MRGASHIVILLLQDLFIIGSLGIRGLKYLLRVRKVPI